MKAAIFHGPGDIRIENLEKPVSGEYGLVLKVEACGICPLLDLPRYKRKLFDHATGIAFGHEFSGQVIEIGPRVTAFKVGDRITGMSFRPCLKCQACQAQDYGHCAHFEEGIAGTWINGGFAEYLHFPFATNGNVVKIPNDMSYLDAALMEPVSIGVGLAGKANSGETAVVLGQELTGLATVAMMKKRGVAKIIVGDLSSRRLRSSLEVGADIAVCEDNENIVEVVLRETSGKGADVVIETAGRPKTFYQSIDLIKEHGSIWLGTFYDGPFLFDPGLQRPEMPQSNLTQKHGISIHCPWKTLGNRDDRRIQAIELIHSGKITADKYVTGIFPLDEINQAFKVAANPYETIKVLIEP